MYFQSIRRQAGLSWLGCLALCACGGRTLAPTDEGAPVDTAAAHPSEPATGAAPVSPEPTIGPEPRVTSEPTSTTDIPAETLANDPELGQCPDPNYPAPSWSPAEWEPYSPGLATGGGYAEAMLHSVQAVIVGSWHGIASTPWTTPYEVDLSFTAGGGYSGRCSNFAECCRAFYYGTDDDTPIKQWRIEASTSGEVFGEIDIAFDYPTESNGVEYALPAWQGKLSNVNRDASGDGLRFEFATSSGYGPVHYDLRRVK